MERAYLNNVLAIENSISKIENFLLYWGNLQEKFQTKEAFLFSIFRSLKLSSPGLRRILTLRFQNKLFFIWNPCLSFPPLILNTYQVQFQKPSSSIDPHLYLNLCFSLIILIKLKNIRVINKSRPENCWILSQSQTHLDLCYLKMCLTECSFCICIIWLESDISIYSKSKFLMQIYQSW